MKNYTNLETINLWNDSKVMTTQELMDYLGELLDNDFATVKNECVFERVKERLGLKFKMPNTNTKEEMLSFGCPENEIFEVID